MDRILHQWICVRKYWPGLVKFNQALSYRYLCHVKKQYFFALPPKLAQYLYCCTTAKVFERAHLFLLPYLLKVFIFRNPIRGWPDGLNLRTACSVVNPFLNTLT